MAKPRTKARISSLQALYELDVTEHALGDVLQERAEDYQLNDAQYEFALLLTRGVYNNTEFLDALIAQYAPEWPLDQIAVIDRNILRIALWELAFYRQTPVKVGINEAVELAKSFGSESASRFVNGVLGSIADNLNSVMQLIDQREQK